MADIVDTTAGFNTVGAEIHNVPAWARNYFVQQTKLMEKLLDETTTKKSPGKILFNSKSVINVNVGGMGNKETLTISEMPTRRGSTVCDSA